MSPGLHSFLQVEGRIHFLAFSTFWRSPTFLGSRSQSTIFKATNLTQSLSHAATFRARSLDSLSTYKDPVVAVGMPGASRTFSPPRSQLINNLNSICYLNYPLPWNLTYSQIFGIRLDILGGMGIILPTSNSFLHSEIISFLLLWH